MKIKKCTVYYDTIDSSHTVEQNFTSSVKMGAVINGLLKKIESVFPDAKVKTILFHEIEEIKPIRAG